jgi:hypothetical protein
VVVAAACRVNSPLVLPASFKVSWDETDTDPELTEIPVTLIPAEKLVVLSIVNTSEPKDILPTFEEVSVNLRLVVDNFESADILSIYYL